MQPQAVGEEMPDALSVSFSVYRPLVDVLLDGQLQDPRAVHGSLRPLRLLAVHPWSHSAAGLDAPGTHRHHAQSQGVDSHGTSR